MTQSKRIGIFGGTFNPIHLGHLRAAEEAAEALGLERVIFVPAAQPPHKAGTHHDPLAPAATRFAWTREAVAGRPGFEVDPLEIERGGRSYTVDTLREFANRLAPHVPTFVIGCDAFAELDIWREPDEICRLAHFAVMTRPPGRGSSLQDWLPSALLEIYDVGPDGRSAQHRDAPTYLKLIEISALEISSSDIRERIRSGLSVRYLVPEAIREEVEQSGAYAGPAQTSARGAAAG